MAALTAEQIAEIRHAIGKALSREREPLGAMTKDDLLAAVAATDQWITDNSGAFNAALPLPARAELTASQKQRIFTLVAEKRFGEGA